MSVALWSATGPTLARLKPRRDFLEAKLEEWVKRDASMVADGVTWVAQQPVLPDGGRPDLIGLTVDGGLVVAELKRDAVTIATLAQALRYVLVLGAMDADAVRARLTLTPDEARTLELAYEDGGTPEFSILLIGTSRMPELDRAAAFLSAQGLGIPVAVVTFTPFVDDERVYLAREVDDHDSDALGVGRQRVSRSTSVERVLQMARDAGVASVFDSFMRTAIDLGLNIKPSPKALTITVPFTHGRSLLYLSPAASAGDGWVVFGYRPDPFAELYGVDAEDLQARFGENWTDLRPADVEAHLRSFTELMHDLRRPEPSSDGEGGE